MVFTTQRDAEREVGLARHDLQAQVRHYFNNQNREVQSAAKDLFDESIIIFWLSTLSNQRSILDVIASTRSTLSESLRENISVSYASGWDWMAHVLQLPEAEDGVIAADSTVDLAVNATVSQIERTTLRELEQTVVRTMDASGVSQFDGTDAAIVALFLAALTRKYEMWLAHRTMIIARTETDNAFERGKYALAALAYTSGLQIEKFWHTVRDARVEVICIGNEGAGWIPLNAQFPTGHLHPLAHVGCRCWCLYRRIGF